MNKAFLFILKLERCKLSNATYEVYLKRNVTDILKNRYLC